MHLPITMGYDRYPELLIDEKRVEDVRENTGFDLAVTEAVATKLPTVEELTTLRGAVRREMIETDTYGR